MSAKQTYSSIAIANNFLEQFGQYGIEHMKLQKLVYFAYGWWLEKHDQPLTHDKPEIWRYGPVFNEVYKVFKNFGRQKIDRPYPSSPFSDPLNVAPDDTCVRYFIQWIWAEYGHMSGFELSELTHRKDSPWYRVAQEQNFEIQPHCNIPDDYIKEAFTRHAAHLS